MLTCRRSLTPGSCAGSRANEPIHIAFPTVGQGRHSRRVISELNTGPVSSPTNASPRHHWSSTHSSGPRWIATPFPVENFHLLLHAGFDRRFPNVPYVLSMLPRASPVHILSIFCQCLSMADPYVFYLTCAAFFCRDTVLALVMRCILIAYWSSRYAVQCAQKLQDQSDI